MPSTVTPGNRIFSGVLKIRLFLFSPQATIVTTGISLQITTEADMGVLLINWKLSQEPSVSFPAATPFGFPFQPEKGTWSLNIPLEIGCCPKLLSDFPFFQGQFEDADTLKKTPPPKKTWIAFGGRTNCLGPGWHGLQTAQRALP